MALHRGIQSAVFYYLSCAPCADARYRRKRKEEAAQGRAEWEELEAQMPNLYRHPSPSSTNPFWQAEIDMGPSLGRGKRKTNTQGSERGLKTSVTQSSNGSNLPSSVDLPREGRSWDDRSDSRSNVKQYQREDERLWGSEPPLRSHLGSGSNIFREPTRPEKAKMKDLSSSSSSTYKEYRNPEVNEMHPAIVTRIATRAEVAWMLQPPPVADVMSGKEQASRSRSTSGVSRPSTRGGTSQAQTLQSTSRVAESLLHSGESQLSRDPSGRSGRSERSKRSLPEGPGPSHHDFEEPSVTKSNDATVATYTKAQKRLLDPVSGEGSADSESTVVRRQSLIPDAMRQEQPRKLHSRPPLSTIVSETALSPAGQSDSSPPSRGPKENYAPDASQTSSDQSYSREKTSRRSELVVNDPSFNALPSANKTGLTYNTQILAMTHSPNGDMLQLPHHGGDDSGEDGEERRNTGGPELFDSWHTPDFELDKWVHEHTKRDVKQRWSMDI